MGANKFIGSRCCCRRATVRPPVCVSIGEYSVEFAREIAPREIVSAGALGLFVS